MRKIFAFFVVIGLGCASVDLTEKSNIIEVPKLSKNQIYQKSIQWITYKYVSGRAVIDYKDPGMGRIIAKGSSFINSIMGNSYYVNSIATIDAVNGKAKISIVPTDCKAIPARGGEMNVPCTGSYFLGSQLEEIQNIIDRLIADYSAYMTGGSAPAWDGK